MVFLSGLLLSLRAVSQDFQVEEVGDKQSEHPRKSAKKPVR